MNFKKLWNNRIFRTFIQTIIATIATYFMTTNVFEIDNKALLGLMISAISTAIAKIMPLFDEEGNDNE